MRKLFTFLLAALMSVGMYATTVTWDSNTLSSIYIYDDESFTQDGVTVTSLNGVIDGDWQGGSSDASFKFSTSLGNFTKIEITGTIYMLGGSGWTLTSPGAVWTGEANETTFGQNFDNVSQIVFTIGDATPEPVRERVIFGVKTPANGAPAAGIMLSGSFTEEPLTLEAGQGDAGWYVNYNVMAAADDTFIIYDAADDNNAIFVKNDAGEWELGLFAFGEVWTDDTWKGDPVKWVEFDMSDNSTYAWANAIPEGVDNIAADVKAVKVLRDGQVLIERDGKTYNLLGAEMK